MDLTSVVIAIIGSGAVNTLLTYVITTVDKRINKEQNHDKAARLIMKDRLRFLCQHYVDQGWIYEDELEDIVAMHSCYHDDLKGNGFLDRQMERVNNLEVRGIGVR